MKDIKWCNDEPVKQEPNAFIDKDNGLVCAKCFGKFEYPQYKDLTDEEIMEVLIKITNNNQYVYSLDLDFEEVEFSKVGIFEFARAILRKAQEK